MLTVESYAFSMISYKKIHFEFFGRIFVKFQSKQATVESCPYPIASPRAGALLSGEYQLNLVEYGPEPCTLSIICLHPMGSGLCNSSIHHCPDPRKPGYVTLSQ
jgi:hypothetical protein